MQVDFFYRDILDGCKISYVVGDKFLVLPLDTNPSLFKIFKDYYSSRQVSGKPRITNKQASVYNITLWEYKLISEIGILEWYIGECRRSTWEIDMSILHRYLKNRFVCIRKGDIIQHENFSVLWDTDKLIDLECDGSGFDVLDMKVITDFPLDYWNVASKRIKRHSPDVDTLEVICIDYAVKCIISDDYQTIEFCTSYGNIIQRNRYGSHSVVTVRDRFSVVGYTQILITDRDDTKNSSDVYRNLFRCREFAYVRNGESDIFLLRGSRCDMCINTYKANDKRCAEVKSSLTDFMPKELTNLVTEYVIIKIEED